MTQTTRRHHINPRFILAGFTETGKKTDRLWSFDSKLLKSVRMAPKSVAWELDFYTTELPGQPPDVAERLFSSIESDAAPIISEIVRTESLPRETAGTDLGDFFAFLALMYFRDQRWRVSTSSIPDPITKMMLKMTLSSPERWEATRGTLKKRNGYEAPSYEEMLPALDRERFDFKFGNPAQLHVEHILWGLLNLPPLFALRNWSILVAEPAAGDFVSSDNPAFISWTESAGSPFSSPALLHLNTEVTFALHRRIALVGALEPRPEKISANTEIVAAINGRTARRAIRYVYAPASDFIWSDESGKIFRASDWFAWHAASTPDS